MVPVRLAIWLTLRLPICVTVSAVTWLVVKAPSCVLVKDRA